MNKITWKKINPTDYFSHINIPDDWNSLEEFADWYLDSKMPLMIPFDARVIVSDDACAICIFKKGNYQVELYLQYPEMWVRKHCHPRMDSIIMQLGGGSSSPEDIYGVSKSWGYIDKNLPPGHYHGGDSVTAAFDGKVILAFQRWENPKEMTSAAIQWKGQLQGNHQVKLIKNYYPNALVQEGYADITLPKDQIES